MLIPYEWLWPNLCVFSLIHASLSCYRPTWSSYPIVTQGPSGTICCQVFSFPVFLPLSFSISISLSLYLSLSRMLSTLNKECQQVPHVNFLLKHIWISCWFCSEYYLKIFWFLYLKSDWNWNIPDRFQKVLNKKSAKISAIFQYFFSE